MEGTPNPGLRLAARGCVLALAAACATPPPPSPLAPPAIDAGVRYFAGSILSGRRPDVAAAERLDPAAAVAVDCKVTYVSHIDPVALQPIATRTRLIVSARSGEPLLPVAALAVDARVGVDESAIEYTDRLEREASPSEAVPLLDLRAAVAPGVTAAFFAESMDATISDSGEVVRKLAAVLVGRDAPDAPASVALLIEDLSPDSTRTGASDPASMRDVLRRQIVLLDTPLDLDSGPIVLAIPSPFAIASRHAFVVRVAMHAADPADPRQADAIAHCAEDLRTEGLAAIEAGAKLPLEEANATTLAASLRALDLVQNHRATLLFLASERGEAPLATDLATAGDDATLAAWAQLVGNAVGPSGTLPTQAVTEGFAWLIEKTAYEMLAKRIDREDLSAELRGMLARHAGEASRFPGMLTAALARAKDRAEFETILVQENRDFLEAPTPSSRVRAYDWLALRGLAPEGFDPLASREERRAALDRLAEATATADEAVAPVQPEGGR